MIVDYNGIGSNLLRKRKFRAAAFLFAVAAYSFTFLLMNPVDFPLKIPCVLYEVTGLYCPGCGGNRGAYYILHGDILKGLKNNLLLLLFIPGFVFASINEIMLLFSGKQFAYPDFNHRVFYILVGIILLYWVLRNLPFEWFSFLRP